ncbi:hypothetical protein Pan216_26910 [Planctomycetes bacterium Pan216]|uniref:Uncharacterized protein n=1 Tax=Kolteria novifilia TaxID=2527975 RepID=A0A518B4H0_9BACT|nr:hypothetical protein Pan216_26910 [Planctomycetes bacterium Pan216]
MLTLRRSLIGCGCLGMLILPALGRANDEKVTPGLVPVSLEVTADLPAKLAPSLSMEQGPTRTVDEKGEEASLRSISSSDETVANVAGAVVDSSVEHMGGTCVGEENLSLERLACMNWPELDALYRQSDGATIPVGRANGLALYPPCEKMTPIRSKVTRFVWRGKIFRPCKGDLINQWAGFRAVKANVSVGPSWVDGRDAVIMDYQGKSPIVWRNVRDEMREVSPGLYLGVMQVRRRCCHERKMYFALELESCRGCTP